MTAPQSYIHATALVIGESGLLLRGVSGSGKSSLASSLLNEAARRGLFARLVGDDRVGLSIVSGRLIARPHPSIAGLIERRGLGIVESAHEAACVIKLVLDLEPPDTPVARMPVADPQISFSDACSLPSLRLHTIAGACAVGIVFEKLAMLRRNACS